MEFSISWGLTSQLPVGGKMGAEPQKAEKNDELVERKGKGIPDRQSS